MPSFYHLSPLFRRKPLSPERFAPVNTRVGSLGTKKESETTITGRKQMNTRTVSNPLPHSFQLKEPSLG